MRVGVIDIGTNSTRLLIADVRNGGIRELERSSIVTRLGQGVDRSGRLAPEAVARVFAVLDRYATALSRHGCEAATAVMTSAVRDADNGSEFARGVRERFGLDARTLSGDEEARLTYLGACAGRPSDDSCRVVIDIGGGSTELVTGADARLLHHVSTQAGVVRQTERHLHHDPPLPGELTELAADVRPTFEAAVPAPVRARVQAAIAVAGTATSCAAIDLQLEPYDPGRVEGHVLSLGRLRELRDRLAAVGLDRRRAVPGLHPDRAPTIVAGVVILVEALEAFGLDRVEVSERDILWGAALTLARDRVA